MDRTLWQLSRHLAIKRKALRELLFEKREASWVFVNVRMTNVYDWSWAMATRVKELNKKKKTKAEFRGFFNCELTTEQKAEVKAYVRREEIVAVEIEDALASGYKLTIVKDGRTDGYQASMQCNDADNENAGLSMSAYAKHWYDALGVLMYKHTIVLKKTWETYEPSPDEEDFG